MDLGFIIIRHVRDENTNKYWQYCIESIRRLYETNPIIIIDDNSSYEFSSLDDEIMSYNNCELIQSEYPGRAELLPYYYFWKLRPFERAVILHDSVFIQEIIDINYDIPLEFLWHFSRQIAMNDICDHINKLLPHLNDTSLLRSYLRSSPTWFGCFGLMSSITWQAIDKIQSEYNFFNLLNHVDSRVLRMACERIFAVLCYLIFTHHRTRNSIYGSYVEVYRSFSDISIDDYIQNRGNKNWLADTKAVKIFTGR